MITSKNYEAYFAGVREIVIKIDPMHLVPSEMTPEDEYDNEVQKILVAVKNWNNRKELFESVFQIFVKQFSVENVSVVKILELTDELIEFNRKMSE